MVSAKTIEIVKATAPVLKKQGQEITTRMYAIMFEKYPEIQQQFDMSAQSDGSQPAKLATAVYAYATHIEDMSALKSAVEKIAHRHVQTHVTAEEYPIVGECLLQAMRDILGEAATDEVIEAWSQAYQALSEVFIIKESSIYKEQASL